MRKLKHLGFFCILFLLMFGTSINTWAAAKNKWVNDNGYYYYYNGKGQKSVGLTKIGGKYYYFNKSGRQLHGWRKIDGKYHCFDRIPGAKGYMLKDVKIDRMTIDANGNAVVKTKAQQALADVLVNYAKWADQIVKQSWPDNTKLKAMAKAMTGHYDHRADGANWAKNPNWHVEMAMESYIRHLNGAIYECQRWACAFSYLAVACGFKNVTLHIGGEDHGWTSIGKRMFNPTGMMNGKLAEFTAAQQKENKQWQNVKAFKLN